MADPDIKPPYRVYGVSSNKTKLAGHLVAAQVALQLGRAGAPLDSTSQEWCSIPKFKSEDGNNIQVAISTDLVS
ncbi:hypothetical protein TNCV_1613131 [Trichonephila clavipes]|nr:hypothetical protein TNCV_1613131 [Trichonephila clavipes]